MGPNFGPAQPPDLSRNLHPAVFRLELLPEPQQATVSHPPRIPGEGDVVDSDPLPLLLGDNIFDVAVFRPGRLQHLVPVRMEDCTGVSRRLEVLL